MRETGVKQRRVVYPTLDDVQPLQHGGVTENLASYSRTLSPRYTVLVQYNYPATAVVEVAC